MAALISSLLHRQETSAEAPACEAERVENDYSQLRIASIFIILVGSLLGAVVPVWLARYSDSKSSRVTRWAFFIAKYFGSGVIVSTAFMHLVSPASEILGKECLRPVIGSYDWAMAIVLITVMSMFLIELLATWFETRSHSHGHSHSRLRSNSNSPNLDDGRRVSGGSGRAAKGVRGEKQPDPEAGRRVSSFSQQQIKNDTEPNSRDYRSDVTPTAEGSNNDPCSQQPPPKQQHSTLPYSPRSADHLGHGAEHSEGDSHLAFGGKITSIVILEAGVVLHSVFIGLTLAVTSGFVVLLVVLVFHQTFEGLGLGSRLATFDWPRDHRRWTPWAFAVLYGLATPVAIAVGLGVKESLEHDPTRRFLVEGFSNAISGGILLYTGVVELMAHEFMFNPEMDRASLRFKLLAFGCMALGAGLMALLAKWA